MTHNYVQLIKRAIKTCYGFIPLKKQIFNIIKKLNIPIGILYKHLQFKGNITVRVEDKSFYMYHNGGAIENEVYWQGLGNSWEEETIWLWIKLCKSSKTIFDIGANTGLYSLIAKTVNPFAKVFAFEPSENTYSKLQHNNNLNNTKIVTEKVALSNDLGSKTFYDVFDRNQTSASLSPNKLKNFEGYKGAINEYFVKTDTLANYIKINNINCIDLIKIDVELHEPEVIEGFGNYLIQFKPYIIMEVLTSEISDKLNAIFRNTGYHFYHLFQKNNLIKVDNLFVGDYKKWNFLLSPNDRF